MAYYPISGTPPQYSTDNNELASGFYLKFYIANTTTPLSMATDSTGSTLLVKCKLNDAGFPISNPLDNETVFVPYVDQNYRLVVYRNEEDADANDTANALYNIADISTGLGSVASLDTGTAPAEVPTNADLGTAATLDTGTAAGEVPTNADLSEGAFLDAGTDDAELALNSRVIGINQTWQDVSASRSIGVTYTNTTGKPIQVAVAVEGVTSARLGAEFLIGGTVVGRITGENDNSGRTEAGTFSFIIPDGQSYTCQNDAVGDTTIDYWSELRS